MELKANELRLNNLLYYKNELKEICSINSDNTIRFKDDEKVSIGCFKIGSDLIKPIPLTEEWLLKFGFQTRKESDNFYYFGFGENHITKDWMLCLKYFKDENKFFFMNGHHVIKYIHQLQNLYFALTNEELEIKM